MIQKSIIFDAKITKNTLIKAKNDMAQKLLYTWLRPFTKEGQQ